MECIQCAVHKKVNDDQIFIFYNRRTPYICILWSAHSAQFMGRIHDGQTSVKVRSPPENIGGYDTVSIWRSAHFYRPDRDRLQSLLQYFILNKKTLTRFELSTPCLYSGNESLISHSQRVNVHIPYFDRVIVYYMPASLNTEIWEKGSVHISPI